MTEEEQIKCRLYSLLPVGSLHMMGFLKILRIRFVEDETNSAAITCTTRPELLLNKQFIQNHCQSDEHLLMLLMHELYHVILGHTRMFERHSIIDNIAFDAVINAILCRSFPGEEYVSFFTSVNDETAFPGCLLRPKGPKTPKRFVPLLDRLYQSDTGTYYEVYENLSNELKDRIDQGARKVVLLGNHESNASSHNPVLDKLLGEVLSKWPRAMVIEGKDQGGALNGERIQFESSTFEAKQRMKRLLRKAGLTQSQRPKWQEGFHTEAVPALMPLPSYQDRLAYGKTILYQQPLLFQSPISVRRKTRDHSIQTLVYLDVSGSVKQQLGRFAPLLLRPYRRKECRLFVFSTEVDEIDYADFAEGRYQSTGGNDIDCVLSHYFSIPKATRPKKILLLTDGATGRPSSEYRLRIQNEKVRIYCGLFGHSTTSDLKEIVTYFEEVPS